MSKLKQTVIGAVVAAIALFVPFLSIAGSLDPSAAPAPTMKTLDQIPPTWSQKLQCDATSCPRFQLVLDGAAVLDKETGLVWEQSPSTQTRPWVNAVFFCQNKQLGNRQGWRLPTSEELSSLVDLSVSSPNPLLPSGHPFRGVQSSSSSFYWSASASAANATSALYVTFWDGTVYDATKTYGGGYIWCVRGGQGIDAR